MARKKKETETTEKNLGGRPRIDIDVEEFEKLCVLQCTQAEIAGWFNCTEQTLRNFCKREYGKTFFEVFEEKSAKGKISLRRAQFRLAETNATMAIFLGKNYLGQTDKQEIDTNTGLTINVSPMTAEDLEVMNEDE